MNTLDEKKLASALPNAVKLTVVEQTGSTNDDLKKAAKAGAADRTVLIAERQSEGRGREGRSFYSERGLYMSVLLPWQPETAPFVTHLSAVAVVRALQKAAGVKASIKWVNDVFVEGKKVCGILTESVICGNERRLVVGIGVNVDSPDFPKELQKTAGRVSCDKNALATLLLQEIFALFDDFCADELRREYRDACFLTGKRVTVLKAEPREATVFGLDDALGLIVRYDDGSQETLLSGEVHLLLR